MINFTGLSHINVVVENMNNAIEYYNEIFNAEPLQIFPNFKNIGFSKSAGFLDNPKEVDVSIAFLQIPNTAVTIELMEYHSPKNILKKDEKLTNQVGNVGHIALKVREIDQAFEFLKANNKVNLISNSPNYKPYQISPITTEEFKFFDNTKEQDQSQKEEVCKIVSQIKYFYFVDQYGIQWELEEGHSDIGD